MSSLQSFPTQSINSNFLTRSFSASLIMKNERLNDDESSNTTNFRSNPVPPTPVKNELDVSSSTIVYTIPNHPSYDHKLIEIPTKNKGRGRRRDEEIPELPEIEDLRIVPALKTYYSRNPIHDDNIEKLNALWRKYCTLPLVQRPEGERLRWKSRESYALIGGETRLKPRNYRDLLEVLNKLSSINEELMPDEVKQGIQPYILEDSGSSSTRRPKLIDQYGRAVGIGRRKTSSAKVYLVRGTGEILVNGKQFDSYFPRLKDRQDILLPLLACQSEGKYNVFALVKGGGTTGQTGAVKLGIAKALTVFNPLLKNRLRQVKALRRDKREVERKKPGKVKARKAPTWVKR